MNGHGDLNNSHASRAAVEFSVDPANSLQSFAIPAYEDDADIRDRYRPFLLHDQLAAGDWVGQLELSTGLKMVQTEILDKKLDRLRILVLYGSLRTRYVHN
jgi:arsenic resistance protein ArsH